VADPAMAHCDGHAPAPAAGSRKVWASLPARLAHSGAARGKQTRDESNLVTASREIGDQEDGTAAFLRLLAGKERRRRRPKGSREERW
jgi:hypothetical protein